MKLSELRARRLSELVAPAYARLNWEFEKMAQERWRTRRPSMTGLIKQFERAGKNVSSVTMPDGTVLHFGEGEDKQQGNELDRWIAKHAH